jgi:hypothetical protein
MPASVTVDQFRTAIIEALSGVVPKPHAVEYDNYANLKIGARAALAAKEILTPQFPST